jgi:hypothetical protein
VDAVGEFGVGEQAPGESAVHLRGVEVDADEREVLVSVAVVGVPVDGGRHASFGVDVVPVLTGSAASHPLCGPRLSPPADSHVITTSGRLASQNVPRERSTPSMISSSASCSRVG